MLAAQINRALGGTAELVDFMPSWDRPDTTEESGPEATIEELTEMMGAVRRE